MPTNTELVQAALDAFGRGDIAALLELCSDGVNVTFFGDSSVIPYAGRWEGKNRVAEYFRIIGETIDVLGWNRQYTVGDANHVAAFYTGSLRVKASGKMINDTHLALDFTAENGKVTGWQVYSDTAALEKALALSSRAYA